MVNEEIREKLYVKADEAKIYYSKRENRFNGNPQLNSNIPRETRVNLIKVLIEEISSLPILETNQGITLDVSSNDRAFNLLYLTTHDFNAGLLRGKGAGLALFKADCPYVDKWTPLVMWALKEKNGLKYEDFWLKGNPLARLLLGRELKDLTVKIQESDLISLSKSKSYVISGLGYKLKRPHGMGWAEEEQVNEEDENRADYNNKETRIVRPNSTLVATYNNDYPISYGTYTDCLSKEFMSDLINYFIIKSSNKWNGEL